MHRANFLKNAEKWRGISIIVGENRFSWIMRCFQQNSYKYLTKYLIFAAFIFVGEFDCGGNFQKNSILAEQLGRFYLHMHILMFLLHVQYLNYPPVMYGTVGNQIEAMFTFSAQHFFFEWRDTCMQFYQISLQFLFSFSLTLILTKNGNMKHRNDNVNEENLQILWDRLKYDIRQDIGGGLALPTLLTVAHYHITILGKYFNLSHNICKFV